MRAVPSDGTVGVSINPAWSRWSDDEFQPGPQIQAHLTGCRLKRCYPHPVVVVAPVVAVPFAATVTSWPLLDEIVPVV